VLGTAPRVGELFGWCSLLRLPWEVQAGVVAAAVAHVVVFVQENHTIDNYSRSMRAWGANVASDCPTSPNPPGPDRPHNRCCPITPTSPRRGFLENHCSGFGANSTPNHLLIVGGQTPTLRNPPRAQASPV